MTRNIADYHTLPNTSVRKKSVEVETIKTKCKVDLELVVGQLEGFSL